MSGGGAATWSALGWSASDWAVIVGAVAAAIVAALVAVGGYFAQQRIARRERRHTVYAEALRAVEDYLEAPYLVARHDGSATTRQALVQHISEVQSRLNYYCGLLRLHAPKHVHKTYDAYVAVARKEAGAQMTAAWQSKPVKRDGDVPRGTGFPRDGSSAARERVISAMKHPILARWRV